MAISVIFCVGSETYIKAEALEWAVPTITAGEAIKWLLGLLGVTVAGGALANTDYEQLADNYTEYAHQQGLSAVDTGKFWADIIDGTLDTGSQAWQKFKSWVNTLANQANFGTLESHFKTDYDIQIYNKLVSFATTYNNIYEYDFSKSFVGLYTQPNDTTISNYKRSFILLEQDKSYKVQRNTITALDGSPFYVLRWYGNLNSSGGAYWEQVGSLYFNSGSLGVNLDTNTILYFLTASTATAFYKYKDDVSDIALILSNAISDSIPDVIPLPWDEVAGTAEGINDKINELIEKVNEGVLSLEDYMTAIQAILGVLAFNPANDLVIPADPALPDLTIQDKINENVNNNGFVLTGLENFFPFCIPFDIYSFITILVAEPVAPVIHWHIYNPVTKSDNIITLDFGVWEPIVILFRYIFDFLFIIGLAMIARSLIGGDD